MSSSTSATTGKKYGLKFTCKVLKICRSTIYAARKRSSEKRDKLKPGPKTALQDRKLLEKIREVIVTSKFSGEGHRKIRARLKREHKIYVSRKRVLRLMKEHKLLSPHRSPQGKAKKHDGRITTDSPNILWGTDATKILTVEDGWVNFFGVIDHWNAECLVRCKFKVNSVLGWHLCKKGDRHAALEALKKGISKVYGGLGKEIARGTSIRPDHGSAFTSDDYRKGARYWGLSLSYSLVKEPETNGVIERFHRTFKEQIIHGREYQNIEELRKVVRTFITNYNEEWLLAKLEYKSPAEARSEWKLAQVA